MNNDKENSTRMGEYSPTSAIKTLKPISPNRATNNTVGKLNFLQNDSLDDHFDSLHTSNKTVQQQLYNIEILSKQTKVDLDQLIERLKNNHSNLNKLLESVVEYSNDRLSETIVTKSDFNAFVSSVEPILNGTLSAPTSEIAELVKKSEQSSQELIRQLLASIEENNEERIQNLLTRLDKSQIKASDVVNPIVAELKAVQLDAKSQTLLEEILHKMNREGTSYIEQEEFQNNTSRDLRDILLKVHQVDNSEIAKEVKTLNQPVIDEVSLLKTVIQDQASKIEQLTTQINKQHAVSSLESKIDSLNSKYETLSLLYKQKFNEFRRLQEEFASLKQQSELSQVAIEEKMSVNMLDKIQLLHVSKINNIGSSLKGSQNAKRIVSSPLVNLPTNSSDEDTF